MTNAINGYKTYIVAAGLLAFGLLGLALGKLEAAQAGQVVIEALAIAGLRHGIAKIQ